MMRAWIRFGGIQCADDIRVCPFKDETILFIGDLLAVSPSAARKEIAIFYFERAPFHEWRPFPFYGDAKCNS